MKRDTYGLAWLMMLLAAGSAGGQSTIQQQNSAVNQTPQGMQRYDQRWQNLGSGHSSLGLESTPHSLDLRFPQSTGIPRPTYGYRPEPIHTYSPPSSALQGPLPGSFALPRSMQPPASVSQPLSGRTRFMVDYTGAGTVPQNASSYRGVTEPVGPVQINPVGPAGPLDRSLIPYQQMMTATGVDQVLQLPRLPWESATEPTPETALQPPGSKLLTPTAPLALPLAGQGNLRSLPTGTGSPLDLILQGGPGQPRGLGSETPSGNLLRPIAPPPEQAVPPPAEVPGSDQAPTVNQVLRQPEVASGAMLNAVARKHLDKAEAHLKAGEYAKAAASYDLARVVAPKSPVPLLGRAVALLATGEYNSSANALLTAVELSPEPAIFRQDFDSLLPDRALVEERIKQLQADLTRFDDFRLRFLLGYAEYCTGDETVGMIDMTQAVHKMPPERPAARKLLEAIRKDQLSRSGTTTAPAARQ